MRLASAETLADTTATWDERAAVGVVLAAEGYPGDVTKGDAISLPDTQDDGNQKLFHAGTALQGETIVTQGGRVMCATALGATVKEAQVSAYQLASQTYWRGMFMRHDIGWRAIQREQR